MRTGRVIGLLLIGIQVASANPAPAISWQADRPLTWADFQGPVPRTARKERVAATAASLSWSYEYEVQWSPGDCTYEITHIDTSALFDPGSSWVRPGHRTDAVLQHEQGHFDIAQIFEQKLRVRSRELVGVKRDCRGRSARQANRHAESAAADLMGQVFDQLWREYQDRQESYDRDTRHGIDRAAQAAWTLDIKAAIQTVFPNN
jgi:hypothetical protein